MKRPANDNITIDCPFSPIYDDDFHEPFPGWSQFVDFMENIAANYPEAASGSHWRTMMAPVYDACLEEEDRNARG